MCIGMEWNGISGIRKKGGHDPEKGVTVNEGTEKVPVFCNVFSSFIRSENTIGILEFHTRSITKFSLKLATFKCS